MTIPPFTSTRPFAIRDPRGCVVFALAAVIVFWLGVFVGFVAGRL